MIQENSNKFDIAVSYSFLEGEDANYVGMAKYYREYLVNNKIIGFIGMNTNYIEGIFVDTNSQHNGIGTLLLNKVKENRNNLILRVYKKNTNAINFYKKNDFIITNEDIDNDTDEIEYTMTWNK